MNEVTNILMVGVGGQGIILASETLSQAAVLAGLDVKKSDVHGMAQRGGSVTSHVRFGPKVFSPLIPEASADFLFATELLEGLRSRHMLRSGGKIVQSLTRIFPPTVSQGKDAYPENIEEQLKALDPDTIFLNNFNIAQELGNPRTATIVLLGALSRRLPFKNEIWEEAIKLSVPEKVREINLKAFNLGRQTK